MTPAIRPRLTAFLFGAALVAAIFLSYFRVHHAGFIWDDESHLTQNSVIIGPLGFGDIWTSARAVYYPLVLTTFWIVHKLVGLNPAAYHLLNVCWHAASAMLLWRVLIQLRVPGAWLGAVVWALHPVMAQSVAWVTEMKNTQSAFFYLLAILGFLRSRHSAHPRALYLSALLSFVAALTSKPSVVMLPVILLLCLWWLGAKLRLAEVIQVAPFALLSLLAATWTVWEQKFHAGATGAEWVQTPLQRLLISARAIWFYLGKLLYPEPLIFIYPRWNIEPAKLGAWLPLLGWIAAAILLFVCRNGKLRPIAFALAYFTISLFPVLDFFDVYFFRYSFVSDHFQYLASMGPLALIGAGVYSLCGDSIYRWLSAIVLLTGLSLLTIRQTSKYHDLVSLYQTTLAQNRGCWMADYNLAVALKERGDLPGAIAHYRHAIVTKPNYVEAHFNLAGLLVAAGQLDNALAHYQRAIELNPADADSHNNYGTALRQLGRENEAEQQYREALRLQPNYSDAQLNLASLLLRQRRTDEAIALLRKAETRDPQNAAVHLALGNALMRAARDSEAAAEFERALQLNPNDLTTLNSFAWLLATSPQPELRNGPRAVQLAGRANQLRRGSDPLLLHSLAAAYAEAGRFGDAVATARRARDLAAAEKNEQLVRLLTDELALYELRLPYHQSS